MPGSSDHLVMEAVQAGAQLVVVVIGDGIALFNCSFYTILLAPPTSSFLLDSFPAAAPLYHISE